MIVSLGIQLFHPLFHNRNNSNSMNENECHEIPNCIQIDLKLNSIKEKKFQSHH